MAHLTLDSSDLDAAAVRISFRKLVKRLERRLGKGRAARRPWIYFGCFARARNDAGYHVHLLLWHYIDMKRILIPQANRVGFHAHLERVTRMSDAIHVTSPAFPLASYIVGQHEAVFGSRNHSRHLPLPKG
jgi:hypothetical protein